jgi:hypothetical protein
VIPAWQGRERARQRRLLAVRLAGWLAVTGALIVLYLTVG